MLGLRGRASGTGKLSAYAYLRTVPTARFIARLIASRLQIPQTQVRTDTDFFTLGGDSLSLSELLVAIEDDFDVVLALDDVLAQPGPAQMARLVLDAESV